MNLVSQFANDTFVSAVIYLCLGTLAAWAYIVLKIVSIELAQQRIGNSPWRPLVAWALALVGILGAAALAVIIERSSPNLRVLHILAFVVPCLLVPYVVRRML
jgi:membrane associated rhomboid family serine protease